MPLNCGNTQSDEWAGRDLSIDCGGTRCGPGDGPGPSFPARVWAGTASWRSGREHMTKLPDPGDALRIAAFLDGHPGWSAFWDKHEGVWRVAEDDPSSELHSESADADEVLDYMATHAQRDVRHDHGE